MATSTRLLDPVPTLPEAVTRLTDRPIPRWGPTLGGLVMFVFVWAVFGLFPTIGFVWALVNDTSSIAILGGFFALPLDLILVWMIWRTARQRGVIKRGRLALGPIEEMVHVTRYGAVTAIRFRYRLSVGEGAAHVGRGLIRGRELKGLPRMPTNADYAIVAFDPAKPSRNVLWGLVYKDGKYFAPS